MTPAYGAYLLHLPRRAIQILHLHFLVIAFSLATVTLILGLSTYLTDTKTYQGTFRTATEEELGFTITGEEYEKKPIIPGSTVALNATANVSKDIPLYVFVKLDIPSVF